ncbi:MAG TPA: FtsX-like permease family protein [Elainellaceae cyanobacterium]
MVSIARKNLFEDIPRFLVAQAGIMFAVSLVTIQIGILNGFTRSTAQLIDDSDADIWVAAEEMVYFELTQPMPLERVSQAEQIEGVERAEALLLATGRWRGASGTIAPVRIIGFNPGGQLFRLQDITAGQISDLTEPRTIITDESSLDSLNLEGVGSEAEINSEVVRLVGLARGTQSIVSSAIVFMSLRNAKAYSTAGLSSSVQCAVQAGGGLDCTTVYERQDSSETDTSTDVDVEPLNLSDPISYVLVRAAPDQDLDVLKQRLENVLPNVATYTREEMANRTRNYWRLRTGIGFVLGLGATVGMIVGMVIVGQILYSSVADHLREYGTLKAMGASDRVIYGVIIEQALWMAALGYAPSMVLCLGLGIWTFNTQGIMILITPLMATGVFGITVVMCVGSALFAIQKVTHVDPAIVFKA